MLFVMPDDKKRIKEYQFRKLILGIASTAASVLFIIWFLASGSSVRLRDIVSEWLGPDYLIVAGYTVLFLCLIELITLPIDMCRGYVLEKKYGLSNENLIQWLKDVAKGLAISLLIGTFIAEVLYLLLRTRPEDWWVIAGLLFVIFVIVVSNLAPVLIFPIFFRFTPLRDDELKERLAAMAEGEGLRIRGVFEMDLSRKTKAANAALAGLGNTRRIILSDTLLENFNHDEVESVLAHELGHHRYHHIWKLMFVQSILIFFGLYCAGIVMKALLPALGMKGIGDIAGLPLLMLTISVVGLVFLPLANALSRKMEISADGFALKKIRRSAPFISCMERLASINLADPEPNPVVEFIFHSHPSIKRRIEIARNFSE